jgi:predicted regulator of Ras-like GTPase activity (Roadblock/LC7/MglB family)
VTDDIRSLSAQYAADPSSLIFLRLAEALRRRAQLDAARKVAQAGLSRYPHLPDAHDLYARILTDGQDFANAFDEWDTALRLSPQHVGAHKGIGFLYYRAGEPEHALYHLRLAAQLDPDDEGLRRAVERVGGGQEIWNRPMPEAPPERVEEARAATVSAGDPFAGLEGARDRLLLVDEDGLRLGGGLVGRDGHNVSDEAAAVLASVTREAGRAARLIELGEWSHLTIEGADLSACLLNPTSDTSLLAAMDAAMPAGQLAYFAERAAKSARGWLVRVR